MISLVLAGVSEFANVTVKEEQEEISEVNDDELTEDDPLRITNFGGR